MANRTAEELNLIKAFVPRVEAIVSRRLGDGVAQATYSEEQKALHATIDYLLGALHSLHRAHALDFEDRPAAPPACQSLLSVAASLDGLREVQWLAGYYFNSALARIAAVFHRGLKIKHHQIRSRLSLGQIDPDRRNREELWKVHEQVNDLKHDAPGSFEGREVTFAEALKATEQAIQILEEWNLSHV
jgi:hypothetical protein